MEITELEKTEKILELQSRIATNLKNIFDIEDVEDINNILGTYLTFLTDIINDKSIDMKLLGSLKFLALNEALGGISKYHNKLRLLHLATKTDVEKLLEVLEK